MFFVITNRTANQNGFTDDRNQTGNTFWLGVPDDILRMLDEPEFLKAITSSGKPVLLFVHGFNNGSQKALDTLKAIADGLGDSFTYVAYLWPSKGREDLIGYEEDRKTVEASGQQFIDALKLLDKPAVLAHSMGNYLVQQALRIGWVSTSEKVIGNFISLAADIDADIFKVGPGLGFKFNVDRGIIFYSHVDGALAASTEIHLKTRLGLTGPEGPIPANYAKQDYTGMIEVDHIELWNNHGAAFRSAKCYAAMQEFLAQKVQAVSA